MVSLRAARTGVANTIFISTKDRYAARIRIAVYPPDTLIATGRTVAMAIDTCEIEITKTLAPDIAAQAREFIERNREALLDYWETRIDTEQLIARLK